MKRQTLADLVFAFGEVEKARKWERPRCYADFALCYTILDAALHIEYIRKSYLPVEEKFRR